MYNLDKYEGETGGRGGEVELIELESGGDKTDLVILTQQRMLRDFSCRQLFLRPCRARSLETHTITSPLHHTGESPHVMTQPDRSR